MESAGGEGVGVHHVAEGRGVGQLVRVGGGEAEHGVERVAVLHAEAAGSVLGHVCLVIVAADNGKLIVVGIARPDGIQQGKRVGGLRIAAVGVAVVLAAAGGKGKGHGCGEQQREKLFHGKLPPK